jgi:hypothetical protein
MIHPTPLLTTALPAASLQSLRRSTTAVGDLASLPSAAPRIVLVLGSAADAVRACSWERAPFSSVVAINNAWQIRSDWDYLIHPEDFPRERWPTSLDPQTQSIVTAADYVPVQNRFGGFVYAGGTMAFTAAYWALGALQPDVIAFLGCDMVYDAGPQTHFYGTGAADPLRQDVTLQSLEAKSLRLLALAAQENCVLVNLSERASSRLVYPRSSAAAMAHWSRADWLAQLEGQRQSINPQALRAALHRESELGYMVQSGRYWEVRASLDAAKLAALDRQWLAVGQAQGAKTDF